MTERYKMSLAARFGPWGEPAFIIVYGPSGSGKTTDALYSFPNGLFLALPGALKPSVTTVGWSPAAMRVETVEEATALIYRIMKEAPGQFDAIVIDDLSLLAENTYTRMKPQFRPQEAFKLWDGVKQTIIDFKNAARAAGLHVVANAHQTHSETKDGVFLRGGPTMPARKMVDAIPHIADSVLRAGIDQQRKPWKGVYHADNGGAMWHEKDRHSAFRATSPMNLAEGLRSVGYPIARAPGMEWQEAEVDKVAARLTAGENFQTVWDSVMKDLMAKGASALHVRWVLRDGKDRHDFKKAAALAAITL
jgi:hypothetical protein